MCGWRAGGASKKCLSFSWWTWTPRPPQRVRSLMLKLQRRYVVWGFQDCGHWCTSFPPKMWRAWCSWVQSSVDQKTAAETGHWAKAGVSQTGQIKKDSLCLLASFPCCVSSAKCTVRHSQAYLPFVGGTVKAWFVGMGRVLALFSTISWSSWNGGKAEQCIVSEMKQFHDIWSSCKFGSVGFSGRNGAAFPGSIPLSLQALLPEQCREHLWRLSVFSGGLIAVVSGDWDQSPSADSS